MKSIRQKLNDKEISWIEYKDFCAKKNGYKNSAERLKDWRHKVKKQKSMSENKECTSYLGVHIAERILVMIFLNVIRMPYGNKGYDFICGKGYKIDVKSACLRNNQDVFDFDIKQNKIADYFLLLAFDNRDDLNPMYIWLIKSDEIINNKRFNDYKGFRINLLNVNKFKKYELINKLDKLKECCNIMRK